MVNAIAYSVLAGSTFVFGPSFLGYLALSWIGSHMAGSYCADRIERYDSAIRGSIRERTGRESPGDAKSYGELVRKTTAALGPFIPALPIVAAGMGSYYASRAKAVESGEAFRERKDERLPAGFAGKCRYRY